MQYGINNASAEYEILSVSAINENGQELDIRVTYDEGYARDATVTGWWDEEGVRRALSELPAAERQAAEQWAWDSEKLRELYHFLREVA